MGALLILLAARMAGVSTVGGGSISFSWQAPTTMGDGSAVSGITGYNVYWSTVPYDISPPNSASVSGAGTLSHTITGLASGTWYVGVSAITASGESQISWAFNEGTQLPYWTI